jgi:signal transduction histidine kinase
MVSHTGPDETALGLRHRERPRGAHAPQHAAGSDNGAAPAKDDEEQRSGLVRRAWRTLRDYLPRGNTLDEATFQRRHLILCWLLGLHVPVLWVMGVWRGYGVAHVTAEMSVPLAAVACARLARNRRLASFFTTFGLVYCSSVLVHLSGGMVEAHFHFFVLIGLIALYQDWVPLLWNVVFTLLSHGAGSALASGLIFNHAAGQNKPWLWAVIHASAVLAASAGVVVFWKNTELEQRRNVALVEHLAAAEVERKEAMSGLLVNLARRNQSLLNRQLEVITDLELREQEADVLEELFRLDHLATRIRRNAESLLVLSGDDPPRRWGQPVPLADVVRAAAAEIENYRRVEVLVNDHIDVTGRAVADVAHLLAELIENATTFSPPSSEVRIRSHLAPGETTRFVVAIEDVGIGMSDEDLRAANAVLTEAPQVDMRRTTMLGFHVVARLAQRYDIQVRLAATPGGGLTALVSLPRELVSDRPADAPPPATSGLPGLDRYQRAAIAWSGDGRRPSLAGSTGPWAARVTDDVAAPASSGVESLAGVGAGAGPVAASPALPELVPPSLAPAWLTTPMPPWYDPALPAESAPFGTTTPLGAATPLGAQPTRLDAAIPLGTPPARLDTRAAPLDPGPADAAIPPARLDTRAAPLDASPPGGPTPLGTRPAGPDARATPLGTQPTGPDARPGSLDPSPPGGPVPHDTQPTGRDAGGSPAPGRSAAEAAEPSRVVPRASGAGAQVHPGTRLGPVAAFVELQMSSLPQAPFTPRSAAAPTAEPETASWWAALVVPGESVPVERASIWPSAAAGPPPLDVTSTPVPPAPVADTASDGLARRVPGSHLAPALRRDAPGRPTDAERGRDADRVRAMLSRFQASQNAGRVAADGPRPRSPEENR